MMEENFQQNSYILIRLISTAQLYSQILTKCKLYCDRVLLQSLKILILPEILNVLKQDKLKRNIILPKIY